jgi:hypothetical protein
MEEPPIELHQHPAMERASNTFKDGMDDYGKWFHCRHCKERGPHVKQQGALDECKACYVSRTKEEPHGVRKLSKDNDMDPFPDGFPHHLPKLTPIEEMRGWIPIARNRVTGLSTAARCFHFVWPGHGQFGKQRVRQSKERS